MGGVVGNGIGNGKGQAEEDQAARGATRTGRSGRVTATGEPGGRPAADSVGRSALTDVPSDSVTVTRVTAPRKAVATTRAWPAGSWPSRTASGRTSTSTSPAAAAGAPPSRG